MLDWEKEDGLDRTGGISQELEQEKVIKSTPVSFLHISPPRPWCLIRHAVRREDL